MVHAWRGHARGQGEQTVQEVPLPPRRDGRRADCQPRHSQQAGPVCDAAVPREIFLDRRFAEAAYEDIAVPIPKAQTISQPYIVAKMLEAAAIAKSDRVLEIGAGSGYLAALAAKLGREVCALERHEALVQRARSRLRHLGCRNVDVRHGDGTAGWPEGGEFDVILVSAARAQTPAVLKAQLAPSGRLLIPLGDPTVYSG
nr:methyltransferase domain-containing protein [Bradyrhizobium barranii]